MMEPGVWVGSPEWRMASIFLKRAIIVFTPEEEKSLDKYWLDVFTPKTHNPKSPLLINAIPDHYQVNLF